MLDPGQLLFGLLGQVGEPAVAAARIASWARSRVVPLVCTQPDTVRARASMSDCSGAS